MIKTNRFKAEQNKDKDFKFNFFGSVQNAEKDKRVLKTGFPAKCFNLTTFDGTLKNGYGIEDFSMPENEDDLENESKVNVRGNAVKTIWKLKWFDVNREKNCYYLFYFNDEGYICYDNLFEVRPATYVIPNTFTDTPYATYYRKDGQDAILLSGDGGNLTVLTGDDYLTSENAPQIISCANHYGKLFAITSNERGTLVYNENPNVLAWSDEKTKQLDFSDDRGDLNKIISFNNYLYIFRDFGITQISEYGSEEDYAISHIYQSTSAIASNSIAQAGEEIFFLEGARIKSFNGNSVKDIELNCLGYLNGCSQKSAYGVCINGKYYLACRGNFGDNEKVGCEGYEGGYKNNMLIIYTIDSGHVDILRGVDINEMVALTNKHKSKLVVCFNNENIGRLGQISINGQIFDKNIIGLWESGSTDFSMPGKEKRVKYFTIQSEGECKVLLTSEKESRTFNIKGGNDIQKINANILGKQFNVKIEVDQSSRVNISEFTITVSARQ